MMDTLPDDILETIFSCLIDRRHLRDAANLASSSRDLNNSFNIVINNQRKTEAMVFRWIYYHKETPFCDAIKESNLDIIAFFYEHFSDILLQIDMLSIAIKYSQMKTVKWIHDMNLKYDYELSIKYCTDLDIMKYIYENHKVKINADYYARPGRLDILEWLHKLCSTPPIPPNIIRTTNAMDWAASKGYFDILKWLHKNGYTCTTAAMDDAASQGHFEIVKWLYENIGHINNPIDRAIANGHLEIVKWLRKNGIWVFTSNLYTTKAAKNGHLDCIKWLHENRLAVQWSKHAMDEAAKEGHLEVVKYLNENIHRGCTTDAMDGAALGGHLDVIKWLHGNRPEGCTNMAVNNAIMNGHMDVVHWLSENKKIAGSNEIFYAAKGGHLKLVKFYYKIDPKSKNMVDVLDVAIQQNHLSVVKWLDKKGIEYSDHSLYKAIEHGFTDVVKYFYNKKPSRILDIISQMKKNPAKGNWNVDTRISTTEIHPKIIEWIVQLELYKQK